MRALAAALVLLASLAACGAPPAATARHTAVQQPGSTDLEFIAGDLHSSTPALAKPARPPQRIAIPSLGIDTTVEHVPFLAIPSDPSNVAWFDNGPAPGEPGDAVMDGHLDWYTGPAVFWHLRDIKPGQPIEVTGAEGNKVVFTVDRVDVVAATSTPPSWLYTSQGEPSLALITCEGSYYRGAGYNERLLVHAVLSTPTTS